MESKLLDINYNLVSFLDGLGFIQGVTLGVLLLLLSKRQQKRSFFLGLFLIFFSFKLLHYISSGLKLGEVYPELYLVPFNFSWLLFALFFVYCQKISSYYAEEKIKYWVLIPGLLSVAAQLIIFFLPYQTKLTISQNFWHEFVLTYLGIFYSWFIGVWTLIFLNRHKVAVNNYFSMVDFKELKWARIFLIYSLISSVVIHILYSISPLNFYFRLLFSILDLISIYWLSFFGIQQYNVYRFLDRETIKEAINLKLFNSGMELSNSSEASIEYLMKTIDDYMKGSDIFTNTDLTIADLAQNLSVHPRKISTAINKVRNQNFNTYVNQFRVRRAQELLENNVESTSGVERIGNDVGFNSKSAFYSAFKKETGLSPKKYKQTF